MSLLPSEFAAALLERARERPDALAFACDGERLTNGRLVFDASRIAAGLAAHGVSPRDRVALVLPAGLDFVRGFAAVSLSGAVPFAISPTLAPTVAMARAARGRPRLILASADTRDELARAAVDGLEVLAIETIARSAAVPLAPPDVEPEDPAILQLTSGTTGEPRFAVLSHRALAAWRRQAIGPLLPTPDDVLAGWVPPWHVMGLMRFVWLPVVCGGEVHLVAPSVRTLGSWLATAARVRATFTSASDFALRMAVRVVGRQALDLRSLRWVATGGEPVRATTIRAFEAKFDLPGIVRPAYGLAEATLAVTGVRPGEPLAVDAAGNVSCGRTLPGAELRIVDDHGASSPTGQLGEIQIRTPALFSGYFEEAPGDSRWLEGGWLATGDWGHLGQDGELYVLGRRRTLLKHGGATFAPRELEEAAERTPGISAAAAITLGLPGSEGGVLVLVAEVASLESREPQERARELALSVRGEIGILPGEVILLRPGTLPRTDSGKLRHAELARLLAAAALDPGSVLAGRRDGWVL